MDDTLVYTLKRVQSFLDEIASLKEIEFPYKHSREAIVKIEEKFNFSLEKLKSFDENTYAEIVKRQCSLILRDLFAYLPLLGFVVRSTEVRNAFEVFSPMLRLARRLLNAGVNTQNEEIKLILSSEWDYSPFIYSEIPFLPGFRNSEKIKSPNSRPSSGNLWQVLTRQTINVGPATPQVRLNRIYQILPKSARDLVDFIFSKFLIMIGLPEPESENPLLVPLAGHEIGHAFWTKKELAVFFEEDIEKEVVTAFKKRLQEYNSAFKTNHKTVDDLDSDLFDSGKKKTVFKWTLKQGEESFCDFFGLRVFGLSYLNAFSYLLSPNPPAPRSVHYPNMVRRVENLTKAAKKYNVELDKNYTGFFEDFETPDFTPENTILLKIADDALNGIVDTLIQKANEEVAASDIAMSHQEEVERISSCFRKVVPAEACKTAGYPQCRLESL